MSNEDEKIIKRLLDRDETVVNDYIEMCSYAINDFIAHYFEDYKDKNRLRLVLAYELYDYIIRKDLLLKFKGKNAKGKDCSLKTYLSSIAKYYFPRLKIVDPLITKTKEKRKDKEDKEEEIIRSFDNEPLNFFVFEQTPIPREFRDEDEAFDSEFFYVGIDEDGSNGDDGSNSDDEDDVVIEFNEIDDIFIDTATKETIELVRQTLEQMPPKEADILKKQFYEGYDAKELAKELGHTLNVIYNLKSKAMRDFRAIYTKLKNGIL